MAYKPSPQTLARAALARSKMSAAKKAAPAVEKKPAADAPEEEKGKSAAAAKKVNVAPRKLVAIDPGSVRAVNAARQQAYMAKGGRQPIGAMGSGGSNVMAGGGHGTVKDIKASIKAGVNPRVSLDPYEGERAKKVGPRTLKKEKVQVDEANMRFDYEAAARPKSSDVKNFLNRNKNARAAAATNKYIRRMTKLGGLGPNQTKKDTEAHMKAHFEDVEIDEAKKPLKPSYWKAEWRLGTQSEVEKNHKKIYDRLVKTDPAKAKAFHDSLMRMKNKDVGAVHSSMEKEMQKEDAAPSDKEIKMAKGIAFDKRYKGGNMTAAAKAIDKIRPGLSNHPKVANALRAANEEKEMSYGKKIAKIMLAKQSKHPIAQNMGEAKDPGEYDYEGDMAKSQLKSVITNAQKLHDMLEPDTNLPEWVQSKITLAEDYIVTAANYMSGELDEEVELDEAHMTDAQMKRREKYVKSMKSADWEKRYPGRGEKVMYATATKMAMKEEIEDLDEVTGYEGVKDRTDIIKRAAAMKRMGKDVFLARVKARAAEMKKEKKEKTNEEAEGSVPKTPREKELAAHHGDPNRITRGDVIKARLKAAAKKDE